MNYEKVYYQIIEQAGNRHVDGYVEWHHIVPRCLGGSDDRDNLVPLTAREHFICHWILTRIHPDNISLKRAAFLMSTSRKGLKVSSRTYQELKENLSHSEETKLKISKSKEGRKRPPMTEEQKEKISIAMKGKPAHNKGSKMSEETKLKMSIAAKTRKKKVNS
tara:strand:- start:48 stop:536 length:489 start_codon:yes stop_codon:yes gene_type:complete